MKTLLITGAKGYLGKFLCEHFKNNFIVIPYSDNLNMTYFLPKCDIIIHCAGRKPYPGMNISEFVENNIIANLSLAKLAQGIPIIYISAMSVYVLKAYGVSKLMGEYILQENHGMTKVLRLPNIVPGRTQEEDIAMGIENMVDKINILLQEIIDGKSNFGHYKPESKLF